MPHPLFPQKIIPQPFPINPTHAQLLSPIEPKLHNLFPTKHPLPLKPENPLHLLLHIPLHTVQLHPKAFELLVESGHDIK
ncbi:PTS glucose transporter subunit IIA, partial [Staphylococcus epidermidis]|uniref:PTS glucose transporter subunit IIA n=1 Tax=Staphylococcus epidermidis TaxID=1282 RepID=UPI0037DA4293